MSTSCCSTTAPAASSVRKRNCNRTACADPLPGSRCCEASCLVEVARRDCVREHGDARDDLNSCRTTGQVVSEPCDSHYLRAKEAYGAILDNLGCICKVLLSLNLESCCSSSKSGSIRSRRSDTSMTEGLLADLKKELNETSSTKSLKSNKCNKGCCGAPSSPPPAITKLPISNVTPASESAPEKDCCGRVSRNNTDPVGSELAEVGAKASCCAEDKPKPISAATRSTCGNDVCCKGEDTKENPCAPKTLDTATTSQNPIQPLKSSGCSKGCCSQNNKEAQAPTLLPLVSQKTGCRGRSSATACTDRGIENSKTDGCCTKSSSRFTGQTSSESTFETDCGGGTSDNSSPILGCKMSTGAVTCGSQQNCCAPKPKLMSLEKCEGEKCCSQINTTTTAQNPILDDTNSCSGLSCCNEIQTTEDRDLNSKSTRSAGEMTANSNHSLDIERGDFQVERIVFSVQGMTCTGCEKKLYKALSTLPEVSNVKTSLVLAQAEFDVRWSSVPVDTVQTLKNVEKMTGFSCSRLTQNGQELDLVISGASPDLCDMEYPYGVLDITPLAKSTFRFVYQPQLIGARDLIQDPFFQSPQLAPVAARPQITSGRAHVLHMLIKTILSAILTIPVLVMAWAPLPEREVTYGAISLALATIIQVYIAGPFYIDALRALIFSRMIEMDLLIVISTTTAYVYSIVAYGFVVEENPLSTGSFFETSTLLVTLIMLGRLVSAYARQRAVESISIESLQSSTALLIDPKTEVEQEIDARLLQYQDIFKVLPDTSIVTDGTVLEGVSDVDESMVTGEATLVSKSPGSPVIAGSINHSGTLIVRLTRLPGENTIKAIGQMVDEAKSSKAKIQEIADRVASYFVPVILAITAIIFVAWVIVGTVSRDENVTTTCINAMTYAISALIVSCPCAIGLAVPMVLVIAGGVAAQHGVIFKNAETIETARNLAHVIFDKTGTLTEGILSVEIEKYPTDQREALVPMLLALTSGSKHPVSIAIAKHLKDTFVSPDKVENLVSVPGSGIEATWGGKSIRAGNPYWLGLEASPQVQEILSLGYTIFCVTINNELVATFALRDRLRTEAASVVNELQNRSIQISIVSGDNEASVRAVAQSLCIPDTHVRFRCNPADKQKYVKEQLSIPKSIVMFCGDGTNDAVALAQASIGVHVDGGTDIAQSAADVVLVRPVLTGIIVLADLSKAFFNRVVFNFIWSFVYNTFAILLAAGAFPNARIPPQFAGLGEIVSVLPVIAVGMQLKWAKFSKA